MITYTQLKRYIFTSLLLIIISCTSTENKSELPDPLEAGWNNKVVCELLEDNPKVRTLKCTFPPGVGHERHHHKAHFGYTLAGGTFRITDTTGTREVTIPTGTDFYNDYVEWHEVQNIGDSTAIFLIVEPK